MTDKRLKIGTRGSPLALKQADMAAQALRDAHPGLNIDIVTIRTSGDWKPADGENRLCEMDGGKGLFVKEIEAALITGEIDCAVHSMKDVPSFLPDGLCVDHVLPRADVRDALVSSQADSIEALPQGAIVGTSSVRRQAFLLHRRPDLKIVPLRGNVQTRLDKLQSRQADAIVLAMAGLNRLGIESSDIHPLSTDVMLPACGQGVVAIETRAHDAHTRGLLDAIHHAETALCAAAERAALQTLDGSCHTPIGAHARMKGENMELIVTVARVDGAQVWQEGSIEKIATVERAMEAGHRVAAKLKEVLPPGSLI